MTRLQANLLLLLAGAFWGMGFVAQSTAMESAGPFLFIGLRFVVATLVMLPFAWFETRRTHRHTAAPLQRADLLRFGIVGLAMFSGMAAQQVGLNHTSVTHSGFITGLYVVFTPIIMVLFLRRWPHPAVWPAVTLSFLGIALLAGGRLESVTLGDLLTLLSAVCWAVQIVLIAQFVQGRGYPVMLATTQFAVVAVLGMVAGFLFDDVTWAAATGAGTEILYTGIFAGALAFTLQVVGQRYTTAPQAVIFLSSEAPFAAAFGALFLDERIGRMGLLGCVFILVAMLMVELLPLRWRPTDGPTPA